MRKEFVSYELALELKELGLDEECLGCYYQAIEHVARDYHKREDVVCNEGSPIKFTSRENYLTSPYEKVAVKAPLWQQAARFLYISSNKQINIIINGKDDYKELCEKFKKAIEDFRNL